MPLVNTARLFQLRFLQGGFSSDAGQYGTSEHTYGSPDQTYGQIEGESTLPGIRYIIVPVPTARPSKPAWLFRAGDTAKQFRASIVPHDDPQNRLDLTPVQEAQLVITELSTFDGSIGRESYILDIDTVNNELTRTWEPDDLPRPGRYLLTIRVIFDTGRYMTIEPNDSQQLEVTTEAGSLV